jgi:hypothetical protein
MRCDNIIQGTNRERREYISLTQDRRHIGMLDGDAATNLRTRHQDERDRENDGHLRRKTNARVQLYYITFFRIQHALLDSYSNIASRPLISFFFWSPSLSLFSITVAYVFVSHIHIRAQ